MVSIIKNPLVLTIGVFTIGILTFFATSPKCHAIDQYKSMTDLQQHTQEGKDWQINTNDETNNTVVMAPHGGGIEPGSSEIAREIANKSNSGYYSFSGIRPVNNQQLHVTSANYNEPKAEQMVGQSERTVSIHKTARSGRDAYIGGRDQALRNNISQSLTDQGFNIGEATGNIAGQNPNNIVNRNKNGAGVQIEVSNDAVRSFFKDGNVSRPARENQNNWTPRMHAFTQGVSNGLQQSTQNQTQTQQTNQQQ